MAHVSLTPRRSSTLVRRLEAWFAGWICAFRDVRSQAELTRKLEGVDDHLLRDIGLTWTGSRYERMFRRDDCR